METIQILLFVLQVLVAVALIGMILIQHGKGADAGAAFGGGSSSTVFGSQGSGSFLTKLTTILAVIFLANSLLLAWLATENLRHSPTSILDNPDISVQQVIEQQVEEENVEMQQEDTDIPVIPNQ